VQFPAWLCLSLFVFTYLLSCALNLNDDDDDDDEDMAPFQACRDCSIFSRKETVYIPQRNDCEVVMHRLVRS